ncbi:hypothetical protein SRHO_G00155800 [Serrasalmus rhombeus]
MGLKDDILAYPTSKLAQDPFVLTSETKQEKRIWSKFSEVVAFWQHSGDGVRDGEEVLRGSSLVRKQHMLSFSPTSSLRRPVRRAGTPREAAQPSTETQEEKAAITPLTQWECCLMEGGEE